MKKVTISIDGMTCSACSNTIDKYLNKQDGILDANVNLVLAQANISYDEKKISLDDIDRFIEESGYKSLGIYDIKKELNKNKLKKNKLIIYGVLLAILLVLMILDMFKLINIKVYSIISFIIAILFIIYAIDIINNGIKKIIHRSPNMDSLVTIGILTSFIYSTINMLLLFVNNNHSYLYFDSVATIIFIVKLGRFIEENKKSKTKEAIEDLVKITPEKCLLKGQYKEKEITIDEVKIDDVLICKPGMKIAVDGIILDGTTHIDESFITGESTPSKKTKQDKVIAGSINLDGTIEYQAKKIGRESTISEIVRMVMDASNTKSSYNKLADTISGYFVPSIIIIAIITFIIHLILGNTFNNSIIYFVNVLLISCPCALGLATPLALVMSLGNSAKNGLLIKNGHVLELASLIDTVIFDKTGTLTKGKLSISKCISYSDYKEKDLINIVANLESKSNHPIAMAFKDRKTSEIKILSYKEFPGIGFKGGIGKSSFYVGNDKIFKEFKLEKGDKQKKDEELLASNGNSIVYIFENKQLIGLIGVKDIIREDSIEVVKELKNRNIKILMLTGDNKITAKRIGEELGIKDIEAEVLPKDKINIVNKYLSKDCKVLMVGDGINDAPALSKATIGMSTYKSTDIATNSSDVILLHDNLNKIIDLINYSNKTIKIIKQNLFWAFFYNIIMIPIATGLIPNIKITPTIAAIAMMLSSLTIVLNTLRLRRK